MVSCVLALAAISSAEAQPTSKALRAKLERHLDTLRHNQQVIRFFDRHGWLLTDPDFAHEAKRQLALHRTSLRLQKHKAARVRAQLARREALERRRAAVRKQRAERRALASLRQAPPRKAICAVFGPHCQDAIAVAHCESRLTTTATNGQYQGLFQMGSSERARFGHGPTAYDQARAAHAYFVLSGRDWSPWSCKP